MVVGNGRWACATFTPLAAVVILEPIATRYAIHVGLTSAFGISRLRKVDAAFSREADALPGWPRNRITNTVTLPTSTVVAWLTHSLLSSFGRRGA